MNKIACFCLSLLVSAIFLMAIPVKSFSQSQSATYTPTTRPAPLTAVRGAKLSLPAKSNDYNVAPEQPTVIDTLYNCGNPSNEEQYQLEMINRARANPDSEGIRLENDTDTQVVFDFGYFAKQPNYFAPTPQQVASDFATYPARPPLAFNPNLCRAARGHDTVMLAVNAQYHYIDTSKYGQIDGGVGGPQTRIDSAGYMNWMNWGENVYDYGNDMDVIMAAFLVDWGNTDLGHRHNIMNFASTDAIWNEIGIAILHGSDPKGVGPILITEDFGKRMVDPQFSAPYKFVLGVVYTDSNKNGLYDIGEGVGGVTITLSKGTTNYAITTSSGGYAIPYTGTGTVTVTATGGPFGSGSVSQTVNLDTENKKVDFIVPQTIPVVKVTLVTPENKTTVTDTVVFAWDYPSPSPVNYILLVSKNANLSAPYAVNDTLDGNRADTASQSRLQPNTKYYWGVLSQNEGGWSAVDTIWSFTTPAKASVDEPLSGQGATSISPNPTAGESHISFTLSSDADVSLRVFNALGEEVKSISLGQLSPSSYDYSIDLSKLTVGSYMYQLSEGEKIETGRIVIMR